MCVLAPQCAVGTGQNRDDGVLGLLAQTSAKARRAATITVPGPLMHHQHSLPWRKGPGASSFAERGRRCRVNQKARTQAPNQTSHQDRCLLTTRYVTEPSFPMFAFDNFFPALLRPIDKFKLYIFRLKTRCFDNTHWEMTLTIELIKIAIICTLQHYSQWPRSENNPDALQLMNGS
jgi:hypothetical protein